MFRPILQFATLFAVLISSTNLIAQVEVFNANNTGLAGFMTAAPGSVIAEDFEATASETDIGGSSLSGIQFNAIGSPLIVVNSNETFTPGTTPGTDNFLIATSGDRVLSPGGVELAAGSTPALEEDDIEMVFNPPVRAFGVDILWQSADGAFFTSVQVFDQNGATILSGTNVPGTPLGGAGGPAGTDFWGVVTTGDQMIGRIVILEADDNSTNPDSNIGLDTIRIAASVLLGDVNLDGAVNFLDISPFISALASNTLQAEADFDENGVVDFRDIAPFIAILSGQ